MRALTCYRVLGSVLRMGLSGDKTGSEGFVALLSNNVLYRLLWSSRGPLHIAKVIQIGRTYYRGRWGPHT